MSTVNSTYVDPNSATLDKASGATLDETMADAWSSNDRHCHGSVGYIGCRAFSSSAQSIGNATLTQVNLGSESYDSDPNGAMHDNVTLNAYVTIKTAGVYLVHLFCQFASNATGYRIAELRLNSTTYISLDSRNAISGDSTSITSSVVYLFAASNTIDAVVYQTSGGALNLDTAFLTVTKL